VTWFFSRFSLAFDLVIDVLNVVIQLAISIPPEALLYS